MIAYDDRTLLPRALHSAVDRYDVTIRVDRLGRLWALTEPNPTGAGACTAHEIAALVGLVYRFGDGERLYLRVAARNIELTLRPPDRLGRYAFDVGWIS